MVHIFHLLTHLPDTETDIVFSCHKMLDDPLLHFLMCMQKPAHHCASAHGLINTEQWVAMQRAELLNAKQVGRAYFVEYTVTKPKQPKKHLLSLVALGNNGRCAFARAGALQLANVASLCAVDSILQLASDHSQMYYCQGLAWHIQISCMQC